MLHIEIGIDPVIAQIGPLTLRWYGLAIMVSIIIAVVITRRELLRRGIYPTNYDILVF